MPTVPECLTAVTRQKGHERVARRLVSKTLLSYSSKLDMGACSCMAALAKVYNQKLDDADIEANGGTSLCTRQQKVG